MEEGRGGGDRRCVEGGDRRCDVVKSEQHLDYYLCLLFIYIKL